MLKNKSKLIVLLIAFIMLVSTVCFATDGTTPGENARTTPGENARTEDEPQVTSEIVTTSDAIPTSEEHVEDELIAQPEIYNGDLYLFDNNIVMDQLVDGNVYLFGKDIEITGKVNGSLFVFGDKITFGNESYVVQSIYACGNEITLNGAATDLYAVGKKVDMNYDSFMIRDLRVAANEFNFKGGVGRDAFVDADTFTFEKTEGASAIVYGNLEYSSNEELELSKEFVQGEVKYSEAIEIVAEAPSVLQIVLDKVISLVNTLILTFVVFFLLKKFAPKFVEKSTEYVGVEAFKALGIGALTALSLFALFCILIVLIAFIHVGAPILLILLGIFAIMMYVSFTITATCITLKLQEVLKVDKKHLTYLLLAGVTLVIWALELIPLVGGIVSILVTLVGFGIIIVYVISKNKKDKEPKKAKEPKKVKEAKKDEE